MTPIEQHKWTSRLTAWTVALAMILSPLAISSARADDQRSRARQHYIKGKELFSAGDYRGAIREFENADRLSPSPVLDFNIGLAHDHLGERDKAISRYKSYLRAMPNARNRAAVEAKIRRLEGELRAIRAEESSRKAEADKAEEARRLAEARRAAEEAEKNAALAAEKAAKAKLAKKEAAAENATAAGESLPAKPPGAEPPEPAAKAQPDKAIAQPAPAARPQPPTPRYEPTGDAKLDRVAAVDIASIRDQRAQRMNAAESAPPPPTTTHRDFGKKKKAKPAYKQWWFWVVVGVSAVILVNIASGEPERAGATQPVDTGAVLFRF